MTEESVDFTADLRHALELGRVQWRRHALERMAKREISRREVQQVLVNGEVIESYPDDKLFPSALFLGMSGSRPIHVVAALDAAGPEAYIITVYEPNLAHFEPDWRTRKKP